MGTRSGLMFVEDRDGLHRLDVAALAVFAVAAVLRAWGYAQAHSLWIDEAMLALNLVELDPAALAGPLPYFEQAAPLGFLWASKLLGSLFGYTEWSLRLLPFVAGTASVGLTYLVLRPELGRAAALVACMLVAFAPMPVRYSMEFKQYGLELFAGIVVIWLWLELLRRPGANRFALIAAPAGLVLLTFSFTLILVMFATGVATLALHPNATALRQNWRVLSVLGVWGLGFLVVYLAHTGPATAAQFSTHGAHFARGFVEVSGSLVAEAGRVFMTLFVNLGSLLDDLARLTGDRRLSVVQSLPVLGRQAVQAGPLIAGPLIALFIGFSALGVLTLIGLFDLRRRSPALFWLCVTLGSTLLVLAHLQVFPLLYGRYTLFLLPLVAACLGTGFVVSLKRARFGLGVSTVLALVSVPLAAGAVQGAEQFLAPQRQEIEPVVDRILNDPQRLPVLKHYFAEAGFGFYARDADLATYGGMDRTTGVAANVAIAADYRAWIERQLAQLAPYDSFWVVIVYWGDQHDHLLLDALREEGSLQKVLHPKGAVLFRFKRGLS